MSKDKRLLSEKDIDNILKNLSDKIISQHSSKLDKNQLVLIGIHRRGVPLGKRIQNLIGKKTNKKLLFGTLDITLYRDDLDTIGHAPVVKNTDIPFDLTDKNIVLVDDVLFTGRTVRAALNELTDFGRPKRIQLAVFIDRGNRELPIAADYIGKKIKTKSNEIIMVRLKETDGVDEVITRQKR
ncbi:MAG: bifunctional pyr operon transcriptional regulator/uracil phosphoribosyltransferase PyrR [Planctomycetota bacterium]